MRVGIDRCVSYIMDVEELGVTEFGIFVCQKYIGQIVNTNLKLE